MDTSPSPSTLYSLSFFLALCVTLFVAATLRLLTLLPNRRSKPQSLCKRPLATRILVVLGSGGHTAEMFRLLKDLDPRKYTHRTYVVSSGDAFSAQRAIEFERRLEKREKERDRDLQRAVSGENVMHASPSAHKRAASRAGQEAMKSLCVGPNHFNISFVPRARKIHQSLLTTPFSCLRTLFSALTILHPSPPTRNANDPYQAAAHDLPDLIITNGPATSVIVVLAVYLLRFFNVRSANSRGKCRTIYVESFARATTLSLSGKIMIKLVDRFLVQWEALEGVGGRAEYWGILV